MLDTRTGKTIHAFSGHYPQVCSLAFSSDGRMLASGGSDNLILLWPLDKEKLSPTRSGFSVRALAVSPDGKMMATSGFGTICLWETETGKEIRRLDGNHGFINCVAFSPNGKMLAWIGQGGKVYLLDTQTNKILHRIEGHRPEVVSVMFTADSRGLISAGRDQIIRYWDVATGRELHQFGSPMPDAYAYAFSPDGRSFAVVTATTRTMSLWRLQGNNKPSRLSPHQDRVLSVAFSRDGKRVACGCQGGTVVVWDATTGNQLQKIQVPGSDAYSVAFSPDGRMIGVGTRKGTISIWEVATGKERCHVGDHAGVVWALVFSKDGRRLFSGSGDTTALVWLLNGQTSGSVEGATGRSHDLNDLWTCLASDDGRAAYSAIRMMADMPEKSIELLRTRLQPAIAIDEKEITRLVKNLGDDRFDVREKAMKTLESMGEGAFDQLRKALMKSQSPEVRRRLEQLLERSDGMAKSGDRLQVIRAIEVLELIGNRLAREGLRKLADGAPGVTLTEEARASLGRLGD